MIAIFRDPIERLFSQWVMNGEPLAGASRRTGRSS